MGWDNPLEKGKATHSNIDFSGGSDNKASAYNVGDLGSVPGLGKSSLEGNGNILQYSCLENPMDRGNWQGYSPWCHKELDMTEHSHIQLGYSIFCPESVVASTCVLFWGLLQLATWI